MSARARKQEGSGRYESDAKAGERKVVSVQVCEVRGKARRCGVEEVCGRVV